MPWSFSSHWSWEAFRDISSTNIWPQSSWALCLKYRPKHQQITGPWNEPRQKMLHLPFLGGHPQFSVISIVFIIFLFSSDHHALGISSFHHYNQPKQRTSVRKIPENYHRFTLFDPSKMRIFFHDPSFSSWFSWRRSQPGVPPPPVTMFRCLSSFLRPELLLLLRFRRSLNCSNCSNLWMFNLYGSILVCFSLRTKQTQKSVDVWGFGLNP